MKLRNLALGLVAAAFTASAAPAIHLQGTNDPELRDFAKWRAKQHEQIFKHEAAGTFAEEAEESQTVPGYKNFKPLWTDRIEDVDGEAEEQFPRIVAVDGGYLEVYTAGAGKLFYETRITKLDANGQQLWSEAIQLGEYTRAAGACQDAEGNVFVAVTTLKDGLTVPYVISFSADGTKGTETALCDGAAFSSVFAIEGLAKGYSVIFVTGTSSWAWSFNLTLSKRDAEGTEVATYADTISASECYEPVRLGDMLMLPFYTGDVLFFNVADATLALSDKAPGWDACYSGCASGNAFYNITAGWGSVASITRYEVDGTTVSKSWEKQTPYYQSGRDLYGFAVNDGNVLLYVKTGDCPQALIMDKDGEIVVQNDKIDFGGSNNSNWVYSGGQLSDGNIALFGMTESSYELSIMTLDSNLKPKEVKAFTNIKPFHPYSYSYDKCSKFIAGDFLFSGFIRPTDYWNHGHTPVFALYDATTMSFKWSATGEPGPTIHIEPKYVTADNYGNSYALYLSFATTRLTRFSQDGTEEWSQVLAPEKFNHFVAPVVLSNGNIVAGVADVDSGLNLYCFTPSGEKVYEATDKHFCKSNGMSDPCITELGENGEVFISFKTYSEDSSSVYVLKVDAEGEVQFSKALSGLEDFTEPIVSAIAATTDGGATIAGSSMCTGDVTCPLLLKVDAEGSLEWVVSTVTDVYCPLNGVAVNNEGIIYAFANTGYHGALFTYAEADGEMLGYDVYSLDTSIRSTYEAITIDDEGNALIGVSYIGEYWSSYDALALAFDSKATRLWECKVAGQNGERYTCNNIGTIDGQAALLLNAMDNNYNRFESLAVLNGSELAGIVTNQPAEGKLEGFNYSNSCIKSGRAYIFYATQLGSDVYYGNLCCIGNPDQKFAQPQQIIWDQEFEDALIGDEIELTATATSGLEVTYAIIEGSDIATLDGSTLTITGAGTIVITASQQGNEEWHAANPVEKTIESTTGIFGIMDESGEAEYYDLQGQRVYNPAPGIYIKRQGNRSQKVVIK